MRTDPAALRRAIATRDAASARVRRLTGVVLAGAAALTGVFTAVAAGSTHPRKVDHRLEPLPASRLPGGPVVAPAPPLVASDQAPVAPPATQPPAAAPVEAPPVVVTGGS